MSGSAALSAARKRRASTAPSANIGSPSPASYYNNRGPISQVTPSFQNEPPQNYIQSYPQNIPNGAPPQPMNIYENIELIKHQLVERTKLIQTQGNSIPVEKLRVLQKQNEIQTQILKQKMAIAKQMEMSEKQQPEMYERRGPVSIQSLTEPEFIYEKGVPRRNPNYKTLSDAAPPNAVMHAHNSSRTRAATSQLTPFVSMLSDTGVIPPPVVVLKSHDAKLEEHNHILHDIVHQLDELHSNLKNKSSSGDSERNARSTVKFQATKNDNDNDNDNDNNDNAEDDDNETDEELLMDVVMNDLTNSREFVEGIVNKIVNETNLSEVIMKIEPLVKENQELRSLIHSQQQMMNEMNTMLFRLLNKDNAKLEESQSQSPSQSQSQSQLQPDKDITTYQVGDGLDGDGLYQPEMTEIVLTHYDRTDDVERTDINNTVDVTVEVIADSTAGATTTTTTTTTTADPEPEVAGAGIAACSLPIVDQDEEYSMPHFPEPISLVVSDI